MINFFHSLLYYFMNRISFKISLIGDSSTGKTSILEKLNQNKFSDNSVSTIGANFYSYKMEIDRNNLVVLQIWDTAGQERYNSILPLYIRSADAIVFVFSLSDEKSLNNLFEKWIPFADSYQNYNKPSTKYFLGNKKDLVIEHEFINNNNNDKNKQLLEYIDKNNENYFEVSAKNGFNITNAFHEIAYQLYVNSIRVDSKPNIQLEVHSYHSYKYSNSLIGNDKDENNKDDNICCT